MIIQSLKKLIKRDKDTKPVLLHGMVSLLLQDIDSEVAIKEFCQELELDGNLVINLIDLISPETRKLTQILIDLLSSNPLRDESRLCQSFISLFKGDISTVKLLSGKMEIKLSELLPVIAGALGNMSVLSEFYSKI